MHIPDGYLGPVTYGGLWAAMVPVWAYASRRVRERFSAARIPFLATASALSLIVMIFTIPLPGGTSGHICGAALIAVLLGPSAAVLAASVALAIQALVFGDGGITALGANCFNIAFAGPLAGYAVYRLTVAVGARFHAGGTPVSIGMIGSGAAAYTAVNLGALLAALELGIQPYLHAGYFPFTPGVVLAALMVPHLAAVGVIEAIVTALVFAAVKKLQPDVGGTAKPVLILLLLSVASGGLPVAAAHDFWIESSGKGYVVVFGHGKSREDYDPEKIKNVTGYDAQGRSMAVSREKQGKTVVLRALETPSMLVVEIDNGYWSKTIYGWKNLPKRKASRVVEAERSINYSKTLLAWSVSARRPVEGAALDIVPLSDPFQSKAGETLLVEVLRNGKPLPDIEVLGSDHDRVASTDREGRARVPLAKGFQVISITHKEALKGDPDADFATTTATLTFEVK